MRRLILWCSFARTADFYRWPAVQAGLNLVDADWALYTETTARSLAVGWAESELAQRVAAYLRQAITWDAARHALRVCGAFDVTALLQRVRAPTLVLHRREFAGIDVSVARALVSAIPDARLALVEGASLVPLGENMEDVLEAIEAFLDGGRPEMPAPRRRRPSIRISCPRRLATCSPALREIDRSAR